MEEVNPALQRALEVRFDSDAGKNGSVRDYLHALLQVLWDEREGFSGKRPFGNSGWENELFSPLVREGFIAGDVEEGYGYPHDTRAARAFVRDLIKAAFYG